MTRAGTTTEQTTVVSTLDRIAGDARAARMSPPAVTVVGDVVDLRETLSWFETKPLFGWRVLVPRTKEQAGALSQRLRRLRRGARGGADHLGRAAAQPAADGQGRPRSRRGPLRVDRLHLGERRQGRAREVRGVRPRRPRVLRPQDRRGRRQDRPGDRGLGPAGRPGAVGRAVRRRAAGGLARVRRAARPDQPGLPAARRHRHREPRRRADRPRLGVRRRHGLPDRARRAAAGRRPATRSRPASSTPSCSRRPRRCATWSASPASRTRRR